MVWGICFVVIALVACKGDPKPTGTGSDPVSDTSSDNERPRGLADQLAYEAAHRPAIATTAEAAFARFAEAGVRVDPLKQYLATTARARYCRGGQTAEGLGISVCEYESEAAATAGRAHVEKVFPNLPGRRIAIRGTLTITTTAGDDGDERERTTVDTALP